MDEIDQIVFWDEVVDAQATVIYRAWQRQVKMVIFFLIGKRFVLD